MPRDGSGIYSQPFPAVVEGTTIESTVYNGYTADITIDLNTPRPISSGGTGANNAADAMAALGGEGSKIEVTNYDNHNFTAGSFYSKASATHPPIDNHAFAGICYVAVVSGIATSDMFIEVRDRDEATQPGSLFVRQKKNGTWSGWLKAVGTTTGATPPTAPTDGMLWWDPTQGKLFIWYSDPNTAQWVEAVATPDLGPDDFVSVDVDQVLTETEKKTARSNIYAAPFDALAYNGMQINGSMEVSQENGTTVVAPVAGGKYVTDNWKIQRSSGATGNVNAAQSIIQFPPGFTSSLAFSAGATPPSTAANDYAVLWQSIEGYRWSRLGWGTASAQSVTIGFWVRSNIAGTLSIAIRNNAGNRNYVTTVSTAAATWEYKTVTIPGDITGTWETGNLAGCILTFCGLCSSGTSMSPTTNTWQAGGYFGASGQTNYMNVTNNGLYITGVVVLPGIEAPSAARSALIMRPFDQELVTCQRYFQIPEQGRIIGGAVTSTVIFADAVLGVKMRAAPTFICPSSNTFYITASAAPMTSGSGGSLNSASSVGAEMQFGGFAGLAVGGVCLWRAGNSLLAFDARL